MTHGFRLLYCLLLSIALVGLLLSPNKSSSAQTSIDDCQDCLSTCSSERQFCLESGNPPTVCLAAWRECVDNCEATVCPLP